jgi:adenosylcobinamide-GDP ribazoletransferase
MRAALAFLTTLGGSVPPGPTTLRWFPIVGALVGLAVGGAWWGAAELWPPAVAAGLALVVDLALTGLLHWDGLADSGDGLLAPMDRDRRLAVMRAPDVGAFGVTVVGAVLVLRFAALASQDADVLLAVAVWAAARAVVATTPRVVRYARPEGLAAAFLGRPTWWTAAALPVAVGIGALGAGVAGAAAVGGTVVGGVAVVALAARRLGGFTGDVLGAAIVVGETAGLVVAAARW